MQIHCLSFAGIGPFGGHQSIDFGDLTASGLFLLEGPTGAGKSTIIDAITFALYGKLAGSDANNRRMRSDLAGPGDESWVDLVFSTSSGLFRVRRSPAFERAKRRGEGTTTVPATAKLWRLSSPDAVDTGEVVATKIGEVDEEIGRVIKLSRDQFVQTVVLPQGQFAAFLQAGTEERRELLQRVFGTEFYQDWLDELIRRRVDALGQVDKAQSGLDAAAVRLVEAAKLEGEVAQTLQQAAARVGVDADAARALCQAVSQAGEQVAEALTAANNQVTATAGVESRAETAAIRARASAEAWQRRTKLEQAADQLTVQTEARVAGAAKVAKARRAAVVLGPIEAAELAAGRLDQAERAATRAGLDPAAQGLDAAKLQAQVGTAAAAVTNAKARLAAAKAHQAAELAAKEAGQTLGRAVDRFHEAHRMEHQLREARLDGIAAEIAGQLVKDKPCPVCGSLSHPSPAAPSSDQVTAQQVKDAEQERQGLESKVEELRQVSKELDSRALELAARSEGLGFEAAAAVLEQAKSAAATTQEQATAATDLAEARGQALTRRAECDQALAMASFDSVAAARAAAMEPEALDRLDKQIQQDQARLEALLEELSDPELSELEGTVDTVNATAAAAQAELTAAQEASKQAVASQAVLAGQAGGVGQAGQAVEAALERLIVSKTRTQPVIRVANLASGGTGNLVQVTLPTYVLMKRFAEVVDAANARLGPMSADRFKLEAFEGREATRARRTGLNLRVFDQATGHGRDPRTLSGGETFYVSLALALGLADVVKAEAGGIDLGTLFIDEGFGSLDAEALDDVLAELGRLRAGGRVVGLVSHVEAMKQAIAERIEVRRLATGGSTLTVRA
ncbi:MAG: SMC family ATPase [Micrococcales bacterium]|nr:SMC family ATPase [Micrococcales bacterium]